MNEKEIIDGYKGIMELDLTDIPEYLKKQTVKQHMTDIEMYKVEQSELKPHLRYENTIGRIQKMHKISLMHQQKRIDIKLQEQIKHNEKYNQRT
jgi:hypothetical protein